MRPFDGPNDYFKLGDWNINCSMCNRKLKASQAVRNWQGQWRCPEHNEPRHPQDFVRAIPDDQAPPWVQVTGWRPNCTVYTRSSMADICTADCARAGPSIINQSAVVGVAIVGAAVIGHF